MKIEVDFENLMLTVLSPDLVDMREILEILESITEPLGTDWRDWVVIQELNKKQNEHI